MKGTIAFIYLFSLYTLVVSQEHGDTGAQVLEFEDEIEDMPQPEMIAPQKAVYSAITVLPPVTQAPAAPFPPLPQPTKRLKPRRSTTRIQTTTTTTPQPRPAEKASVDDQCAQRLDIVSLFSCTNCTSDSDCRKGQFVCCSVPYILTPILLQSSNIADRKCCVIKKPPTTTTEATSTSTVLSTSAP
uniref:WAP domain-containing protein n=1 Tax=Strigamia maritima TaxID=126957 RepID=T1JDP1_STRMM